jgi:hypothetical protein
MPEKTPLPQVGETVYFYDPELIKKIGFGGGYGNRKDGPYAAIVANDLGPGLDLFIIYPERQPAFVREKVPERPADADKEPPTTAYWTWLNNAQKARAVQRAKEDAKP